MKTQRLLFIMAFVCFVLAMFPITLPVSLVPLGLALWVLGLII